MLLILGCLLCAANSQLAAQSTEFAPVGAVWKYWNSQEWSPPYGAFYRYRHVTHDTIIDGYPCKGVSGSPKKYNGQHDAYNKSFLYLRTSNDSVFVKYLSIDDDNWHFLYDFGAEPGDIWLIRSPDADLQYDTLYYQIQMLVVDTGTTHVLGQDLKYIALENINCDKWSSDRTGCGVFTQQEIAGDYPPSDNSSYRSTVLEKVGGYGYLYPFQIEAQIPEYSCSYSCGTSCYVERQSGYAIGTNDCELLLDRRQQLAWSNLSYKQNPSQETISIAIKSSHAVHRLRVIDMLGRKVYNIESRTQETTISTAGWAPGVYVLQVANESGDSYARKFVVE